MPLRRKPIVLSPTTKLLAPSMVTNGGTSLTIRACPPTIAMRPIRQNWWTATPPETNARSSTVTCPASITLLAKIV